MQPTTIIEFADVSDCPKAELLLPSGLRIADQIELDFTLTRTNPSGRYEVLEINGEFRVSKASVRPFKGLPHPHIQIESTGKSPAWRAVKKPQSGIRQIPPACAPRTVIEN